MKVELFVIALLISYCDISVALKKLENLFLWSHVYIRSTLAPFELA